MRDKAQAFACEKLEDLAGPHHLAHALRQGLALLAGEKLAQFVLASDDLVAVVRVLLPALPSSRSGCMPGASGVTMLN